MIATFFNLLDPMVIIKTVGLIGIIAIIFAESGLFFGFFLPGDSLLFTAGFLASQDFMNIYILVFGVFLAAVLGDSFGYFFGKKVGPKIFTKEDSFFFHKDHVKKAQIFYEKYGNKTIVLARFVPIVRTFAPIVAGVGNMKYRDFLSYNLLGGFIWSFGLTLIGFFLGEIVPDANRYIVIIVFVVIVVSFLPIVFELIRSRKVKE